MEIIKSHWESHDGQVTLGVPITKVDRERRIVSGFATLDNLDSQGDIVLSEASKDAFDNFAGNVREMHDKIAAGRVVNFREQSYFDPQSQKVYTGIYVDVYVSRGAESTWEKCLDGTLAGFSIGGVVPEGGAEQFFDETLGKFVNIIKKYILVELSLVDSPANKLASVFAVQKSDNGESNVSGIAVGVETVDVFWCSEDNIAIIGTDTCDNCGVSCEKVGWIESNLSDAEKVQAIAGLLKNTAKPAVEKEEGVTDIMADETVEKTTEVAAEVSEVTEDAVVEKSDTADEVTAEATTEEVAETTSEAAVEEIDWQAELNSLRTHMEQVSGAIASITKALESTTETIGSINKAVAENASKVEALAGEINETVSKTIETTKDEITDRLGAVEKSLVVKKASDRTAAAAPAEKKDIWADRFTVRSL
jgi:archaellum component FlaC